MNVKLIIAITFLLVLTVVIVILAGIYISNNVIKTTVISVIIIIFVILTFLIGYKLGNRENIITIRNTRDMPALSAMSANKIISKIPARSTARSLTRPSAALSCPQLSSAVPSDKSLAVSPAISQASPISKLSTEVSRDPPANGKDKESKSPGETCYMDISHIHISHSNDASFNIFTVFISRIENLMQLNLVELLKRLGYKPASFGDIAQMLYNESFDVNESFRYLKTLLDLAAKVSMGTKIRNYENIFKLLKLFEFTENKIQSDRVYALDELGFNFVLLAAASTISYPSKETYDSIHGTLSDMLYRYKSPSVDIRSYYIRSFSRYFEKFRISETLIPMVNGFGFVEGLQCFLAGNKIKFKDKHGNVGSLEKMIDASMRKVVKYTIITFYPNPEYNEGARQIDRLETERYRIRSIIFRLKEDNALLSVIDRETVCLITGKDISGITEPKPSLYKRQETLLKTIEKIDETQKGTISLLSSNIIAILYQLDPYLTMERIKPVFVPRIDFGNVNDVMRKKKEEFKDSIIKKFLDKYNSFKAKNTNTVIFRVLEFIRLSTGSLDGESYKGVIAEYLFGKGNAGNARISVVPFIENVMKDFFETKFYLAFSDEEDSEKIWKSIIQEIEFYKEEGTTTKALLEDAIENAMTLFSFTLNNISPFAALKERVHCDYILATIYLIKRLWKVYDRCITAMRLLPEKSGHDDQEKLLRYLLLKFNKLIYVKCYFASFSNNLVSNQELEEKRLELRKHL